MIADSEKSGLLKIVYVDVGPVSSWGRPRSPENRHLWPAYSLQASYPGDLVLVDGRFRVACVLSALRHDPERVVLLHDYTDARREYYGVLEEFCYIAERGDSLVRLVLKPETPYLYAAIQAHSYYSM